ncbi:MAG: hypothetical protein KDA51_02605 [Planctomycetales bacterium]|nr:hypothetical protein [Planctomycetales bacterium]
MNESPKDRWLAYELHDGLLQWIIGARLQLLAALGRDEPSGTSSRASMRKALTSLEIALEEGRELIGYLEQEQAPAGIKFATRLQDFVDATQHDAQQHQQQITLEVAVDARSKLQVGLSDKASWNLLRIVEQAIRNAIQHAGPTRIDVHCQVVLGEAAGERDLLVTVSDLGRGFELHRPTSDSNHFGLNSMAHRARLIGARLSIDSQIGAGCRVECRLQLCQNTP